MVERKTQFNVYLPPELVRAVKHRCIDEGTSLSAYVERSLGEHLRKHEAAPSAQETEE
jgi:hypothetical protein